MEKDSRKQLQAVKLSSLPSKHTGNALFLASGEPAEEYCAASSVSQ